MTNVYIYSVTEIVSGGCNVCPTSAATMYTIECDDKNKTLIDLDAYALIQAVAMLKGFKYTQEFDVDEDIDNYIKGVIQVSVVEKNPFIQVLSKLDTVKIRRTYPTHAELYDVVSDILATFFELGDISFIEMDN